MVLTKRVVRSDNDDIGFTLKFCLELLEVLAQGLHVTTWRIVSNKRKKYDQQDFT